MRIVCPTCGSPASRPIGEGSSRECSMCYTRYEIRKPKAKRSEAKKTEQTPDDEPDNNREE